MRKSIGITTESIISDHYFLVQATEGLDANYSHDYSAVDSALNSVFQTIYGKDLYPSKEEKAARLFFNFATGHTFKNGNKRIAAHLMIKFLMKSGIYLEATDEEITKLAEETIVNKKYEEVVDWVFKHKKIL